MMKKKFIATLLVAAMLVGNTVTAYADETPDTTGVSDASDATIETHKDEVPSVTPKSDGTVEGITGKEVTVGVSSEFSVKPSDLSGLTISVPAKLDLIYNDQTLNFEKEDYVTAKGDLADNCILDISVKNMTTYTNDNDAQLAYEAPTEFKRINSSGNFQYWTPAELETAKTTEDRRNIKIELPSTDVKVAGEYTGLVNFDISIQKFWNWDNVNKYYSDSSMSSDPLEGDFYSVTLGQNTDALKTIIGQSVNGVVDIPKYVKNGDKKGVITELNHTFCDNTYIKEVTVPNTVTSLSATFYKCSKLKKVILPENLISLQSSTFENCTSLTDIIIPDSITEMSYKTWSGRKYDCDAIFSNCTKLKNVTLSKNMKYIPYNMFYNCTSLENINIPNKVSSIGAEAFYNCTSLKSISLPYSLQYIAFSASDSDLLSKSGAFNNDTNLKDIYYSGTIEDAKNIYIARNTAYENSKEFRNEKKLGSIDYTTETETTSTKYILGHATWHCTDGDFVPAELATTTTE